MLFDLYKLILQNYVFNQSNTSQSFGNEFTKISREVNKNYQRHLFLGLCQSSFSANSTIRLINPRMDKNTR